MEAEILKPAHPIFYGYDKTTVPVRWAGGPLLRATGRRRRNWILMRFPGTDRLGVERPDARRGGNPRPAGDYGRAGGAGARGVVRHQPGYRWQNLGEFNMLANAILNFNDYPKPAPGSGGRGGTAAGQQ